MCKETSAQKGKLLGAAQQANLPSAGIPMCCWRSGGESMTKLIDLTGQRFGRLTVVSRAENTPSGQTRWDCICDCGKQTTVRGYQLRSGRAQSCGCYQMDRASECRKKKNVFRITGNVVFVKLTNSDLEMLVDLDIWENGACDYCWSLTNRGYAATKFRNLRSRIFFHKYAFPDCPNGMVCDHIDGNRLNNTRQNIRFVTSVQNCKNHKVSKSNTSGYTGVSWQKMRKSWVAYINFEGKRIHLGCFLNLQDAIAARKQAEIKYFGEYRRKD